ncbi:MAG: amidase [bacterium]
MADFDKILDLDGLGQADLVKRGEVQPIELVDAAIGRIERLNPHLNAVVTPMFDLARETAQSPTLPDGPFKGVPFLMKDLGAAFAGVRQTSGSVFLKEHVSPIDSDLTVRQKQAGLITLGKTNTPEFGILPTTEPKLFGATHNPWNLEHTPGGSSGGSAAAVASGMVALAHGNDGGGSIRIPASCCGLFGLKPTRARNSFGPVLGDVMGGLPVEHGVTRSVRDSAALLDATAGPTPGDPYWAPPLARPLVEEVGADPGKLRIAVLAPPYHQEVHEDCIKALRDAATLCESLGHVVEEKAPALDPELTREAFLVIWTAGAAWSVDANAQAEGREPSVDQFEPLTWALAEQGRKFSAAEYLLSVTVLQMAARGIGRFMTEFDVLLCPTQSEPPPPLGSFDSTAEDPMAGLQRAIAFVPFTPWFNVTGQPAMSVPLHWNGQGLPIGVQFAGRFGDEATLIRLAAQLEAARPWADRRPGLPA